MIILKKPFHGEYRITQAYGVQSVTGKRHMGIDWALPMGTPVFAAADGMVTFAGKDATGYGNCVIIRHGDGSGTVYAHLSDIMIANGQYIFAGISVGRSGSTGTSTGPHLHFEYRRKADDYKSAIDPMPLLNRPIISDSSNDMPEPVADSNSDGIVQVICDTANIRLTPDGDLLGTLQRGAVLKLLPEIKITPDRLVRRKAQLETTFWIAEQDGFGTKIIGDV